jgi:hypothetical protein
MRTKFFPCAIKLAIIATVLTASSQSASAYWPYFSTFSGWCGGYNYYSTYSQESVPYYALNPPVYYSYPVARTYGLYPFPYYAERVNDYSVAIEPKMVINKFVDQKITVNTEVATRLPLRIVNPFVEQTGEANSVKQAGWEEAKTVKPKVVHPIELTSSR